LIVSYHDVDDDDDDERRVEAVGEMGFFEMS